jgi:2,6-dihydroxypseudooxynicotine hydrolase
MYRKLGEEALAKKKLVSAGEFFVKATLGYHFGQFLHYNDPEGKERAHRAKLEVHAQARPLVRPSIQRLKTFFEGVSIPIHIRIPVGPGPHPTVIIVCGMDSTKEEYFVLENCFLERGLAVVGYDGPGQGEVWPHMKMRPDYYKVVTAVADTVSALPEVDGNRIALLGQSLGGLLAPMAASHDSRFRACAVSGAFYDLTTFNWDNPIRAVGLPYILGVQSIEEAKRLAKDYTLAGCIQNMKNPVLVIHGSLDKDSPASAVKRIVDEASGPGWFMEFPEGIHMCHNIAYKVKPLVADWLVDPANGLSSCHSQK